MSAFLDRLLQLLARQVVVIIAVVAVGWPAIVAAAPGAISQNYETDNTDISQGALLSLASAGSTAVVPATSASAANLVGVAASQPLLELSNGSQHSIQVVTGGVVDTLVSDSNGTIKVGDKITASPIGGIGMKAIGPSEVVGTAQADFSSVKTVAKSFAGKNGQTVTVNVGLLPVAVNVSYYSASSTGGVAASFVPPAVQEFANLLTGKQVSPLRVLLGSAALLLGFIAATIMLYTSIRSGVVALGRNPLAEGALRKGLIDVIIAATGVLIITAAVVYVVLAT